MSLLRSLFKRGTDGTPEGVESGQSDQSPSPGTEVAARPLRIFVGYDARQLSAFHVACESLIANASVPVSITPLLTSQLPLRRVGNTPFSFARYLVPWLCGFRGWGLFLEPDVLVRGDITELFAVADSNFAVMIGKCAQPDEWSSLMLFNCAHPLVAALTPATLEDASKTPSDDVLEVFAASDIGELPLSWCHTVGFDLPDRKARLVHYPFGVPSHVETHGCEFTDAWMSVQEDTQSSASWSDILSDSRYASRGPGGRMLPNLALDPEVSAALTINRQIEATPALATPVNGRAVELLERYQHLHAHGDLALGKLAAQMFSGAGIYPHVTAIRALCNQTGARRLLDFGCGKALAHRQGVQPTPGAAPATLVETLGVDDIALYDPAVGEYRTRPDQVFDGVVCTEVLEYCAEADIPALLDEIFSFATGFVFLSINCQPGMEPNEVARETVRSLRWWQQRILRARWARPMVIFEAACQVDAGGFQSLQG